MKLLLFVYLLTLGAKAFTPIQRIIERPAVSSSSLKRDDAASKTNRHKFVAASGLLSGLVTAIPQVLAETDVEVADLPPAYIPVLFGLGLVMVRSDGNVTKQTSNSSAGRRSADGKSGRRH